MNLPPRSVRLAVLLVVFLLPVGAGVADDTDFFSAKVPPNVLLFIDESGSMRNIIQHPYFDAAAAPYIMSTAVECDALPLSQAATNTYDDESSPAKQIKVVTGGSTGHRFEPRRSELSDWVVTPDTSDDSNQGYVVRRYCGHDRKLYTDPFLDTFTRTLWPRLYLNWYFHLEPTRVYNHPDSTNPETKTGAEILAEIDDAQSGRDYISGAGQPEYQVARITAAKRVAKEIMYRTNSDCPAFAGDCLVYEDRVRFGIAEFRGSDGAYVSQAPTVYDAAGKASLETTVDNLTTGGSTPLGETLFQLYTYFMKRGTGSSDAADRPAGENSARLPSYQYEFDGNYSSSSSNWAPDPIAFDCQKQFIIMITDGAPTDDQFETNGNVTQGFSDFRNLIGDFGPDLVTEDDWDQTAPTWTPSTPQKEEGAGVWPKSDSAGYLDDIARFMQDRDLRGDIADKQVVDVYTVGFTTIGPVNTMLSKAARNGNGKFFSVSVGGELADALSNALADVIAKTQSFAAATVPASRATDGNNFYVSYFDPSATSPLWKGHLKAFEFNALGEVRDEPTAQQLIDGDPGDCALDDATSGSCSAGALKLELDGYWDAANEIPSASTRSLFVSKLTGSPLTSQMVAFTAANVTAADLGLTSSTDVTQWDKFGNDMTGLTDEDDLRDAVVNYARGCEFSASGCTDRPVGRRLFDVFHSSPVVAGSPNAGLREPSYRKFIERYKHRKRVIYAGSNGGFLHGFNAGEYGTSAVPGAYDRGDGVEEFGFMPYPARQNIAELPINSPRTTYYVDASPSAADVWYDPTGLLDDQNPANWNAWRTLLIGGMRQGGNVVWALDVTNPPDHDSSTGEQATGPAYPAYLWEFPCEDATDPVCNGSLVVPGTLSYGDYMAETWSRPIITRVRVTVSCDEGDTGCAVEDRWVAIFGAGYDATGDPNLPHNPTDALVSSAADYDSSHSGTTSRKGRALFMLDITSGEVLAMQRYDDDPAFGEPAMRYALAATPSVFDLDFDGYADVVYIGDLGGNMWKWVIHDSVRDPINGAGGDELQPSWPFHKIFTAQACDTVSCVPTASGPPQHFRSFFTAPQGAMVGSKLWLTFGSGERNELDFAGTAAAERNRFYVMKDVDPFERELSAPSSPQARYTDVDPTLDDFIDVASVSTSGGCSTALPIDKIGYYVEGADGEKFITETEIFFGVVLTGSYTPSSAATTCDVGGDGTLYGFRLLCGEGIFSPDPSNPTGPPRRKLDVGSGIPTQPRVSVGPVSGGGGGGGGGGPCTDTVVVITSEGEAFSECPGGRPDSGVHVQSWRDR